MFGFIYMIQNKVNGKMYIGQTINSLNIRWGKHVRMAQKGATGIAGAIYKYGVDNFDFVEICKAPIEELNDLEIFYINKYDSYNQGYNLTLGGEGSRIYSFTDEEVIKKYQELGFITDVAKYFDCSVRTISHILHKNEVTITRKSKTQHNLVTTKPPLQNKPVRVVQFDKEFDSLIECARWLIEKGIPKTNNPNYVQKGISKALVNNKSYCKLNFEYIRGCNVSTCS